MANSNNNCSCSGLDLVGLSSSLAVLISQNANSDDLSILGAFFTTLGDNLSLIATSKSICQSNNETYKLEKNPNQSDDFFCDFNSKF